MSGLVPFTLPLKGLRTGIHAFQFTIGASFFQEFEQSLVQEGALTVKLELDKQPNMFVLNFDLAGVVDTECDRCLAAIQLPVATQQQLLVKLSEEAPEDAEDPEVLYLHPETSELNVASYIYEYTILAIPMIKVYNCAAAEPRPCNQELLDLLAQQENAAQGAEAPITEANPIWDELKKQWGGPKE